jgi:hypothetical protein
VAHPTPPLAAGDELERARSLTLRYVIASTAILGVAGLLGVMLRDSQAGVGRIPERLVVRDDDRPRARRVRRLGRLRGDGLAYWVLAQVGFPLSRRGLLAEATWWLMVVGVGGVVVTCLAFKFGGSWVFLYPLSFHSAGSGAAGRRSSSRSRCCSSGSRSSRGASRSSTRCSARRCTP